MLALLGGKPVRTRTFAHWPVFGAPEEERLLRTLRSGSGDGSTDTEVEEFEAPLRRDARLPAWHRGRQWHGLAADRADRRRHQAEDEVIVPPYTFSLDRLGGDRSQRGPGLRRHRPEHVQSRSEAVEAAITPRTRAIIPVHFAGPAGRHGRDHGHRREHNLIVIEDAAHAHGASYSDRPAGSLGTWRPSRFSRARTSRPAKAASLRRTTTSWPRRAARSTTADASQAASGTSTTSISGNYRLGEFQGRV